MHGARGGAPEGKWNEITGTGLGLKKLIKAGQYVNALARSYRS
jgi:hypothetical protein